MKQVIILVLSLLVLSRCGGGEEEGNPRRLNEHSLPQPDSSSGGYSYGQLNSVEYNVERFYTMLEPEALADLRRDFCDSETPALWSESANLNALNTLIKKFVDKRLIEGMKKRVEILMSCRSGRFNRFDPYLQRSDVMGWGTRIYTCGNFAHQLVHNATLASSILNFYNLQFELGREAYDADLIRELNDLIEVFSLYLRSNQDQEYYMDPMGISLHREAEQCSEPIPQPNAVSDDQSPMNMQAAALQFRVELMKAKRNLGDDSALEDERHATGLANYLKTQLAMVPGSNAYTWLYRAPDGRQEDVAHGGLVVKGIVKAFEQGIVFSAQDMRRLANSFETGILYTHPDTGIDLNNIRLHLFGALENSDPSYYEFNAHRWSVLAPWNKHIPSYYRHFYYKHNQIDTPENLAMLLTTTDDEYKNRLYPHRSSVWFGTVYKNEGARQEAFFTGLVRTSNETPPLVDGISISSCALYEFPKALNQLVVRASSTDLMMAGDSCTECGIATRFFAFTKNSTGHWQRVAGETDLLFNQDKNFQLELPELKDQVLLCRGGWGAAAPNVLLREVYLVPPEL